MPRKIFGEEILPAYYQTLEEEAPGPWALNVAFLEMWDSTATEYGWVMPDGFTVKVKIKKTLFENVSFMGQNLQLKREVNEPVEEGRSIGANVAHSIDPLFIREMTRRCSYDPVRVSQAKDALAHGRGVSCSRDQDKELTRLLELAKCTGYLSARVIDFIDHENVGLVDRKAVTELLATFAPKPFAILTNHDCFRFHPNYGNEVRRQYNRQLYLLAKSDIMSWIASSLLGTPVELQKIDPSMADGILEANYALS